MPRMACRLCADGFMPRMACRLCADGFMPRISCVCGWCHDPDGVCARAHQAAFSIGCLQRVDMSLKDCQVRPPPRSLPPPRFPCPRAHPPRSLSPRSHVSCLVSPRRFSLHFSAPLVSAPLLSL
eukprot:1942110-Rhodomonas_salina.1